MMLVTGLGLGMVMQVLFIAVQNAIDHKDLGVSTSAATLFRLIGGSVGTAALGALFSARLAVNLRNLLPANSSEVHSVNSISPRMLDAMPPALRAGYAQAFTNSLHTVNGNGHRASGVCTRWVDARQKTSRHICNGSRKGESRSGRRIRRFS